MRLVAVDSGSWRRTHGENFHVHGTPYWGPTVSTQRYGDASVSQALHEHASAASLLLGIA